MTRYAAARRGDAGKVKISVVTPVLDEEAVIRETLASVRLRAGVCPVELIVVDGGSQDGTVGIAGTLADQVLVAPRGRASQMNHGAAAAGGDLLLFLHADTIVPVGYAGAIEEAMADPAVVWGRFDVELGGEGILLPLLGSLINLRSRFTQIATGDQGIFVRREAFHRAGGYPEFPLFEDVALSRALKCQGRSACLAQKVRTSARRWEKRGLGRTIILMWVLRALFWMGVPPSRLSNFYHNVR